MKSASTVPSSDFRTANEPVQANVVAGSSAESSTRQRPSRQLTAGDVMSTPVVTISIRESLWDAWSLLYSSGLRHLVVVDGSRCVGVIDDRRIALEWPLGPSRDMVRRVGQIITGRARCVLADTTVRSLARIMLRDRVDVLPVVTHTGDLVGLVTASDLLSVLTSDEPETDDVGGDADLSPS